MRRLLRRLLRLAFSLAVIQLLLLGTAALIRRFVDEWGDEESNEFQLAAILDGRELRSRAKGLRGGTVIVLYGGAEVDLRGAELAAGGAVLRLTVVFGGVSILVPEGWRVRVLDTALLGGIEKRTTPAEDLAAGAPELTVQATTIFGGAAVRAKALESKAA